MNFRLVVLVLGLVVAGGIMLHAAAARSVGRDALISEQASMEENDRFGFANAPDTIVPPAEPSDGQVVSSNVAVAWKSKRTGTLMHASLNDTQMRKLKSMISSGMSMEEGLDQLYAKESAER